MNSDRSDTVDELTNDLDELKTTVEELADVPSTRGQERTLDKLKQALDDASDAADELEEQQQGRPPSDG